jgi:KDO2-lipid IV(A) lauroyltransferase
MIDDIIFILLKLLVNFLSFFPRRLLKFFSDLLGLIWYQLDKKHRHVVFENIRYAYPELSSTQREIITKKIFKNIASILFEIIWSYRKTGEEFFKYFEVKGLNHLEKARKKNRGVIMLTAHMGNFELLVGAIAKIGVKPYGIYRKLDFEPLERLLLEERQRFGTIMVPLQKASQGIEAILNKGGIMGTLLDQNANCMNGVFVDFFNRPACTKKGVAKLVMRSKAAVVPMFIVRKGEKYVVEFLPEIPLEQTGCKIKDVEKNTQNYVSAIESMIRTCPEQYFWVHNRWKTKNFSAI